eukprot:gnl/Carplike_NY0171/1797_a2433_1049.p1 GENE.gnl/Carplike_NY0171/1797_a2433_1049~~gnl/Carplike_NY0171/1797_a2433_1049.p1  ORF type:complete len:601 (-),score=183.98 gnl/Carplike_NY0171/1797_a2433_1049:110-1912(-)
MITKEQVQPFVEEWLANDIDPETRKEVETLFAEGKYDYLHSILSDRMTFGTAGLRGPIKAGFMCMNELTILQAAQGLIMEILKSVPESKKKGIVIGYDARNKSTRFAEITAACASSKGMKVYLFSKIVPTPMVPFGVTHFGAAAGVMVTASHNPSTDNGYKVYWHTGVQIISPVDKNIQKSIMENLKPWFKDIDSVVKEGKDAGLITDPEDEVWKSYFETIRAKLCRFPADNSKENCKVKIGYSAMHGVGYRHAMEALRAFGFDVESTVVPIKEQVMPDGSFPTSDKPNPEERSNMEYGTAKLDAMKSGAVVHFANDPDADRIAVAEKRADGTWRYFHGNEIGALIGQWMYDLACEKFPEEVGKGKWAMVNSTVSSKFLRTICSALDVRFAETLTGFKWIGTECQRLEDDEGMRALYGFEESIGYMCSDVVRDKDGISACAVIAEIANHLYRQGKTLDGWYEELSKKLGYHIIDNGYVTLTEMKLMGNVFHNLRFGEDGGRISSIAGSKIIGVRDQTSPFDCDTSRPDGKTILPTGSGQMITFTLDCGIVLTLRASGTEPKLKWYSEVIGAPGQETEELRATLKKVMDYVHETLIGPFTK